MRYYLIPKEEHELNILSETWCIGEDNKEDDIFLAQKAWKIYNELIKKSTPKMNLLLYYELKNSYGKKITWKIFKKILENKKIVINKNKK